MGLTRAAEEALRQQIEVSGQVQLLKRKHSFLKLQMSEVARTRDDAAGSAAEQGRQVRMLKARAGFF